MIVTIIIMSACTSSNGNQQEAQVSTFPDNKAEVLNSDKASSLLTTVCYACHNPSSASHDEMLAPPLVGIKMRYMKASESRTNFINRMTAYVSDPKEESALMKGPIKRFGLMPKTALSEEEIKSIVTFIYDNELPAPDWFADHEKKMHGGQ